MAVQYRGVGDLSLSVAKKLETLVEKTRSAADEKIPVMTTRIQDYGKELNLSYHYQILVATVYLLSILVIISA